MAAAGGARVNGVLAAWAWGGLASLALAGAYVGSVAAASRSFAHAAELLGADWPFLAVLATGFGAQVGLTVRLRALHRTPRLLAGTAGVATGTSTAAMVACCAHHVTDVVPFLGAGAVAGVAGALTSWRMPLMVAGIAANLVGVGVSLWRLRAAQARAKRQRDPVQREPEVCAKL